MKYILLAIALVLAACSNSCQTGARPDDAIDLSCAQAIATPSGPPLKAR